MSEQNLKELVSVNGVISNLEDAKITVFDRGFLYGDAIYEVTRTYNRIYFELEAHIERLYRSAQWMEMKLPRSPQEMIHHLYDLYKKVSTENVYMRIQISRGAGKIGMSNKLSPHVNEVVIIYPFQPIDTKFYEHGVKVFVTSRLRNEKKALDPNIKSGNYLNNVLAYIEGEKRDAFETVMVNSLGHLTEATVSNIFMIKDGVLVTPPSTYDILEGITRRIVFGLAKDLGYKIEEKGFTVEEIQRASEVFLTSSTREIVPVNEINGKKYDVSSYQVVPSLIKAYKNYIQTYLEKAKKEHPWS